MARSGMRALCLAIAAAALLSRVGNLRCFVPGPLHRSIAPAAGASAAALFAPAAFADVNSAAKKLADLSYPMVKATDWATTGVLDKYVASVPTTKEFLTLRVSPPAHPGTMPRRADGRREEETHIVKQRGQQR